MGDKSIAVTLNRSIAACWILVAACLAAILLPSILAFMIGLIAFSVSAVLCVIRLAVGYSTRSR